MIWQEKVKFNNKKDLFNNFFDLEMNDLVDEMIDAVDDGDGEIDYDEFVKMIQKYWEQDKRR